MANGSEAPQALENQRYSLFHADGGIEHASKAWHAPYADVFSALDTVLDLGCGPGYFLDLLRERNVPCVGIDLDPHMVRSAQARGHVAQVGDHNVLANYEAKLGGIHLSHIIEHLWGDDAVTLLERSERALLPGGVLVIRTPNWGNEHVRHGGFWLDHTHKRPYPLELLQKVLGDLRFEILDAGHEPQGWQDTYVIAKKPGHGAAAAKATLARVQLRGDLLLQHSLARVNRELTRALQRTGEVDLVPMAEPTALTGEQLRIPLRRRETLAAHAQTYTIRHQWPPRFMRPASGKYIHIQPSEYGIVPADWAREAIAHADDVWCYSSYVRELYLTAGVPAERTHVVPLGVDPEIYCRTGPTTQLVEPGRFVFLFVGAAIVRKGLDALIEAYAAEFRADEPVTLVIKEAGAASVYRQQPSLRNEILALVKRTDLPQIRYSSDEIPEQQLAMVYRSVGALVHPYRGEGFALPVLEAMACGTPVIVTKGGATDDFVDEEVGYRIAAERRPVESVTDELDLNAGGWMLEPNIADLRRLLRRVYEHRDEARERGERGAERVARHWTWDHSARVAVERLRELNTRAPLVADATEPPAPESPQAYESRVFSQNGEDGILFELFARLGVDDPFFVEFGAETGSQCNAANLARSLRWRGLFIEGDETLAERLRENYADFPKVRTCRAMVTRENIVALLEEADVPREFDLLSIDIDGNDYHVWKALGDYRPRVVVIEFNPAYPPPMRWVMQYNPAHSWQHDDYYGASLSALAALGKHLGYDLIGTESNGVNAFFVRSDLTEFSGFPRLDPEAAYSRPQCFQPHRDGPAFEDSIP